jgi:hypothetical protein
MYLPLRFEWLESYAARKPFSFGTLGLACGVFFLPHITVIEPRHGLCSQVVQLRRRLSAQDRTQQLEGFTTYSHLKVLYRRPFFQELYKILTNENDEAPKNLLVLKTGCVLCLLSFKSKVDTYVCPSVCPH